ncbi:MAG: hypothetical protein AAGI63_04910 [Planctomycetota bacterium]
MRRLMNRWWLFGFAIALSLKVVVAQPAMVGRRTIDRDQDLFQALLDAGRYDDAIEICENGLKDTDPRSDRAAKWTIRKSAALSSRQLAEQAFSEDQIAAAQKPVTALLRSYPDHTRSLFLDAQVVRVQRDAAKHAVLRAAISPSDNTLRQSAAGKLVRAARVVESLSERVADEQARLGRDIENAQAVSDFERLEQELQVEVVSLSLAQTELFARGSQDGIAAAIGAEEAADEAMARLPNGSAASDEVNRLRMEAILRADQARRADAEWDRALKEGKINATPRYLSLRIRTQLALEQRGKAESLLAGYYGADPSSAPLSVEMDLARLEFLLQKDQGQGVGAWLDEISNRGGAYARRRAEAWSLNYLKQGSQRSMEGPRVDPSLIAAQAKDWLRRGDVPRAAELLSAAAATEADPSRAITRAIEAAASWVKAGSPTKAAEVLSDIALSKPDGTGAADAHLQAVVLIASTRKPDINTSVESMLRRNMQQWPRGKASDGARRWLIRILDAQSRHVEAAVVASTIDEADLDASRLDQAFKRWLIAYRSVDDNEIDDLDPKLREAFEPLQENPGAVPTFQKLAALMGSRSTLQGLKPVGNSESWVQSLVAFRPTGTGNTDLSGIPVEYHRDVIRRLMLDGRQQPQLQDAVNRAIASLPIPSTPSVDLVERLLWQNNTVQAIATAESLIETSPDSSDSLKRLATLLGSSRQSEARQKAIKWWDQLAAGTTKGSDLWHTAKLEAIKLLAAIGQTDQSKKRAKYILLTNPNLDPELRRSYQAAAK